MKTMMYCLIFSIIFLSFKKQDAEDKLLGNWKLVGWYDDIPRDINNDGNQSTDLFSQWDGCKKQSTLILSENNSGKIIYNGNNNNPKCPAGFNIGSFFTTESWEVTDENRLEFIGDDYNDSYQIIKLDSSILVLKGSNFITCCDSDISYFTGGYLEFRKE